MQIDGNILALDLATALGFAYGRPADAVPTFGTEVLPSTGNELGPFIQAYHRWLVETLNAVQPQIVVFEQPSTFSRGKTAPIVTQKLVGLVVHTEWVCHRKTIPIRAANPSTMKKFFTGRGRAEKDDMRYFARKRGWPVTDDNQADACACWAYSIHCYAAPEHAQRFALGPLGASA